LEEAVALLPFKVDKLRVDVCCTVSGLFVGLPVSRTYLPALLCRKKAGSWLSWDDCDWAAMADEFRIAAAPSRKHAAAAGVRAEVVASAAARRTLSREKTGVNVVTDAARRWRV